MAVKSYALTTAQRAADYAGLGTLSGSNLTLMETLVDQVTEVIEDYIGFRVKKTTYSQEEYDTERADSLNLKNYPVISSEIFLLERRPSAMNEDDWETVDSQYYHVDYENGIIFGAGGLKFARTRRGYRVTYTAGYDYDNTNTYLSDTEGAGLELAAWILLETIWNKRKGGGGVKSEAIGDYKIVYKKTMFENEEIMSLLDKYARIEEIGVITPYQT